MKIIYGRHIRMRNQWGQTQANGGVSVVVVEWDDGSATCGASRCSDKDLFVKAKGHKLAEERAILAKAQGTRVLVPTLNGKPDQVITGLVAQALPPVVLARLLK